MKSISLIGRIAVIVILPLLVLGVVSCEKNTPSSEEAIIRTDRVGYIDKDGNFVIEGNYEFFKGFSEGLAAVETLEDKWGFIDRTGEFVIEPQFRDCGDFSEGLAPVMVEDGRMGYIDRAGKIVIEPAYMIARSFSEGYAIVGAPESKEFINKEGINIFGREFWGANDFSDGLALVYPSDYDKTPTYINTAGEVVLQLDYDSCGSFHQGLAFVKKGGKYGYIDKTGELVIGLEYDECGGFSEGIAPVRKNDKWFYIDKDGREEIEVKIGTEDSYIAYPFKDGLALVGNESGYGFIDKTGTLVIDMKYDGASSFSEGLAPVQE